MLLAVNGGQVKKKMTIHLTRHSNSVTNVWITQHTARFRDMAPTSCSHNQNQPVSTPGPADPNAANVYTKKGRVELKNTHSHLYTELVE